MYIAKLHLKDGTYYKKVAIKGWQDAIKVAHYPKLDPSLICGDGEQPVGEVRVNILTFVWTKDDIWTLID